MFALTTLREVNSFKDWTPCLALTLAPLKIAFFNQSVTGMRTRLATYGDIPQVVQIASKVVPLMQAEGNFQWDVSYPCYEHFRADVLEGQLWVAVDNLDKIIGFAALTTSQPPEYADSGCDISLPAVVPHRLAVDPAFRRCGAAQLFFTRCEQLALEKGFSYVRVDTNTANIPMQQAILKAGYELKGEISLAVKAGSLRFVCFEKAVHASVSS